MKNQITKISKRLSYVLRHQPEAIHLNMDEQGWVNTQQLLENYSEHYDLLTEELLQKVVAENDKKRFEFNEDQTKIRASQGHSIQVDLAYEAQEPPEFLFHGTATRFINDIRKKGLIKQNRHHVHLSKDEATARNVGTRHGVPVILTIKAKEMHEAGFDFFISTNGVWLVEEVPTKYMDFPQG